MPTNHAIPVADAASMTRRFRTLKEKLIAPEFSDKDVLPLCETFDRSAFDTLLAQPGCQALRIYYGMDEDDKMHAILVGVDASGNDMLSPQNAAEPDVVMNSGVRCPTSCPPPSELNT